MTTAPHQTAPPSPSEGRTRTVDRVVSWLFLAVLALGALVLGFMSMFSVFATDSCGTGDGPDPAVCDTGYFTAVLVGYWVLLGAALLGALAGVVTAIVRGRRSWPWPSAALGVMVVATPVFVVLMSR